MKDGRLCTYERRCTDLWTCIVGPVCGIHTWVLARHEPAGVFGVMNFWNLILISEFLWSFLGTLFLILFCLLLSVFISEMFVSNFGS